MEKTLYFGYGLANVEKSYSIKLYDNKKERTKSFAAATGSSAAGA